MVRVMRCKRWWGWLRTSLGSRQTAHRKGTLARDSLSSHDGAYKVGVRAIEMPALCGAVRMDVGIVGLVGCHRQVMCGVVEALCYRAWTVAIQQESRPQQDCPAGMDIWGLIDLRKPTFPHVQRKYWYKTCQLLDQLLLLVANETFLSTSVLSVNRSKTFYCSHCYKALPRFTSHYLDKLPNTTQSSELSTVLRQQHHQQK